MHFVSVGTVGKGGSGGQCTCLRVDLPKRGSVLMLTTSPAHASAEATLAKSVSVFSLWRWCIV